MESIWFKRASLPNWLSITRGPLGIILLVGYFASWSWWLEAVIFNVGALTDYFDGFLSRRLQAQSDLGKQLDPLFDKILMLPMFAVVWFASQSVWLLLAMCLMAVREVLVSYWRNYLARRGQTVAATQLAKGKTIAQIAMIDSFFCQMLGGPSELFYLTAILAGIALALALASAGQYLLLVLAEIIFRRLHLRVPTQNCRVVPKPFDE